MQKSFFDEELVKSTRLILCPSCENKFKLPLNEIEAVCDECGEEIFLTPEKVPDEFVWHPSQDY